jgi:flagellar motility protein MotE (MotC chaperone)
MSGNFRRIRGSAMNTGLLNVKRILIVGFALTLSSSTMSARAAVTVPAPATEPAKPALAPQISETTTDDYTQDARILGELARRKAALDRREHELDLRETQLSAAELLARKEVGQLTSLRGEVEKIVNQQTDDASADLAMLAGLFANMKPAQAAAILGKLDIAKAAAILRRLPTRMAGPVLAAMDPTSAAGVTQELQRAHAPFQDASATPVATGGSSQ